MTAFLIFGCLVVAQTDVKWNELISDYRELGLPVPPTDAVVIFKVAGTGAVSDDKYENFELAVAVPAAKGKKKLFGIRETVKVDDPSASHWWTTLPKSKEALDKLQARMGRYGSLEFNPLFPLQASLMGRDDVLAFVAKYDERMNAAFDFRRTRPPDHRRRRLNQAAWNHWCREFAEDAGDRSQIVGRLERMLEPRWNLATDLHRTIVADMKRTLEKKPPPADPHHAAIEKLLDLKLDHFYWLERRRRGSNWWGRTSRLDDAKCQAIYAAGLDAVPALVEHLGDFRLTRCVEANGRGEASVRNIRVADAVAAILYSMAPDEEFTYQMHDREGRGVVLDRRHVLDWLQRAKAKGELDTFLAGVFNTEERNSPVNLGHLRAIADKYPAAFGAVFRKALALPNIAGDFGEVLDVVCDSRLPQAEKIAYLKEAANTTIRAHRAQALFKLVKTDRNVGVPMVVLELDAIRGVDIEMPLHLLTLAVAEGDDQRLWDALERTARRMKPSLRVGILLGLSARSKNPAAIPFWEKFLNDDDKGVYRGPCSSDQTVDYIVKNLAAERIAFALDMDVKSPTSEQEWAELHRRVREELQRKRGGK